MLAITILKRAVYVTLLGSLALRRRLGAGANGMSGCAAKAAVQVLHR